MLNLREQLKARFGFEQFLPGQEAVMEHLMAGRSAAAVFPTGAGKSLCYQLPALLLPALTLVVSPLIALMKDQIDQLKGRGIPAARLDSTLNAEEYRSIMEGIRASQLRILYVAPERFNNERFRQTLSRTSISLFAVDEAHCISEWGHNFRPDYLKLAGFVRRYGADRLLALTATATPRVLEDICNGLSIDPACAIRTGFYRPNLKLITTPIESEKREHELLHRLSERPSGATIVYVTLQRTAEQVAERLTQAGFVARPYHAGMQDEERSAVQDWFLSSEDAIVAATIAFGMGIDKPNIRYVYHYNLPKSLENLSQEMGRAGRDGKPAICESFFCPSDLTVLENFAYGDTPAKTSIQSLLEELIAKPENFDVSLHRLAWRHDIRILVLRTLLTYLELEGFLEAGTPTYSTYQFKPLVSSQQILAEFQGERRAFLASLLQMAKRAKTWLSIDLEIASRVLKSPRQRLVRALDFLAERQWIELKVGGVRNHFRRVGALNDLERIATELFSKSLQHEHREIERLGRVLELAAHDGCQTRFLCSYFGQDLEQNCGHCGACLRKGADFRLLPRPQSTIDDAIWEQAVKQQAENPEILSEPRALSRFLTGLSSPQLTRARLTSHELFGALAEVPFNQILERAEANQS